MLEEKRQKAKDAQEKHLNKEVARSQRAKSQAAVEDGWKIVDHKLEEGRDKTLIHNQYQIVPEERAAQEEVLATAIKYELAETKKDWEKSQPAHNGKFGRINDEKEYLAQVQK